MTIPDETWKLEAVGDQSPFDDDSPLFLGASADALTEDLKASSPILRSDAIRQEVQNGLDRKQTYFDPFNNQLTTCDEILECLRRFGVVYATRRYRCKE